MDTQQRNAAIVADFLANHPGVRNVFYPGHTSHTAHDVHQAQARGGGAVLSFLANSATVAKSIAETSKMFRISRSFGSVTSTISIPARMSHASVPSELLESRSIPESLLRLSVGIEDADDLIADLKHSLTTRRAANALLPGRADRRQGF